MAKIGDFLYFVAWYRDLDNTKGGIFKYDLVNGGPCVNVVPYDNSDHVQLPSFAALTGGTLLLRGGLASADDGIDAVWHYSSAGALIDTYAAPTTPILATGLAADPDGLHFFAGGTINEEGDHGILYVTLSDGSWTGFPDEDESGNELSWALTAVQPDEPPPPQTYAIRRLRRAPHLNDTALNIFHHRFVLDLESGLGTTDAPTTAPLMYLRWSDDGGHTWSEHDHTLSAGIEGQYKKRLFRNRLGKSRDRIYEVSTTDPAVWNLVAAYLALTPGTS